MRRLLALAAEVPVVSLAVVRDLTQRAEDWIDADPDETTRDELRGLLDAGDMEALDARLNGSLTFGTAGIRGEVGAGPNRMNRAVVIRTTRGLADYLLAEHDGPPSSPVIVGFDARPTSRLFAEDTAGVLAAAGIAVFFFPEVAPTPLVAFAAKHLHAAGAVVVTASHNPPADNGYKVYSGNAAQIIPPVDTAIAAAIEAVGPAVDVPRTEGVFGGTSDRVAPMPENILDSYWEEVNASRPDPHGSDMTIVYTPIHGVGGAALKDVFERAGHTGVLPVPAQADPDGTFPTVSFPNPEEEGALDLALDLAAESEADLIIANDPDADRLAAVVKEANTWRPLTGNEIGVLLGDYVLRHHTGDERPIVINSIVSSPMLERIARKRGALHQATLTGFKWIVNAGLALEEAGEGRFVFGYEEALGYTVGSTVRDKDGISSALIFCDLVAGLREHGETVLDRLGELWASVGVWASAQHSIVRSGAGGAEAIRSAVDWIAGSAPEEIAGYEVADLTDYRTGGSSRPSWLGEQALVELSFGERGRALVRPSGTEPKLKVYVDLSADAGDDPHTQQTEMTSEAGALAGTIAGLLPL